MAENQEAIKKKSFNPQVEIFSAFKKPFSSSGNDQVIPPELNQAAACCACTACTACR